MSGNKNEGQKKQAIDRINKREEVINYPMIKEEPNKNEKWIVLITIKDRHKEGMPFMELKKGTIELYKKRHGLRTIKEGYHKMWEPTIEGKKLKTIIDPQLGTIVKYIVISPITGKVAFKFRKEYTTNYLIGREYYCNVEGTQGAKDLHFLNWLSLQGLINNSPLNKEELKRGVKYV